MSLIRPVSSVKYWATHPAAQAPVYNSEKAAGFDLHTVEPFKVADHEIVLVRTGLIIETPENHMLYITFRSSTPRKHGITVLTGIIDEDYCGPEDELYLQVQGLGTPNRSGGFQTVRHFDAGMRIAQGIFVPASRAYFNWQPGLPKGDSRGGLGSTG